MNNGWIRKIRKGDILRAPSGLLRIVREVAHSDKGTYLSFVIKRCSWTQRCYTTYVGVDLVRLGYSPTGKHASLTGRIDRKIERELGDVSPIDIVLHCCDVRGIS